MNIAIFDHDRLRADKIRRSLVSAGYAVALFKAKERFFEVLEKRSVDVFVLGVESKSQQLIDLVSQIKSRGVEYVIVIDDASNSRQVAEALDAGASDFICLPLRLHELQERLSIAAWRIFPDSDSHQYLQYGDYVFGRFPNTLFWKSVPVKLSAKEFDLALFLFRHFGQPLSRAHIADAVWGMDANDLARTIDTHVSRVRNKLYLKPENGFLLEQVYGFGYQLLSLTGK